MERRHAVRMRQRRTVVATFALAGSDGATPTPTTTATATATTTVSPTATALAECANGLDDDADGAADAEDPGCKLGAFEKLADAPSVASCELAGIFSSLTSTSAIGNSCFVSDTALRLTCRFEQDKVSVTSAERLAMVTQESDPTEGFDEQVGFWSELRDEDGHILYRQIRRDPFRREIEVFSPEDGGAVAMAKTDESTGHLVLLMPDLPGASHIALVRAESEGDEESPKRRVVEVALLSVADAQAAPVIDAEKGEGP